MFSLKETHDEKGQRIKYMGENVDQSISEMILQEKMSASDDYDRQFASRIAKDITYKDDIDYMDDKVDQLARRNAASETKKRQIAVLGWYILQFKPV
jgi:hypothetical protein